MATKRKWGRYLRGVPNYDNDLRCVLPTASGAVRKAIKSADQRHGDHDTSHLLVEETLHTISGGTTTVEKLARHYFETATHLVDQCV